MRHGDLSSSKDCVGVGVINYKIPVDLKTKQDVLNNCRRITTCIDGLKVVFYGMDLIVLPEFSTQGVPWEPDTWLQIATTVLELSFGQVDFLINIMKRPAIPWIAGKALLLPRASCVLTLLTCRPCASRSLENIPRPF